MLDATVHWLMPTLSRGIKPDCHRTTHQNKNAWLWQKGCSPFGHGGTRACSTFESCFFFNLCNKKSFFKMVKLVTRKCKSASTYLAASQTCPLPARSADCWVCLPASPDSTRICKHSRNFYSSLLIVVHRSVYNEPIKCIKACSSHEARHSQTPERHLSENKT